MNYNKRDVTYFLQLCMRNRERRDNKTPKQSEIGRFFNKKNSQTCQKHKYVSFRKSFSTELKWLKFNKLENNEEKETVGQYQRGK